MRITIAVAILFVGVASAFAAVPAERKAWQWTIEQRLALRTDPAAAKARVSASQRPLKAGTNQAAQENVVDTITGKTHPELFLPHEVFDELVQFAFLSKPGVSDAFRKAMMPTVSQYGLPDDFWERLRNISAVYIADANRAYDFPVGKKPRTEMSAREQREFDREHDRNYSLLCRSRVDALAEARRQFGGEVIDRFLYGAIAPNMFRTAFDSESAENLRRLEEGCR